MPSVQAIAEDVDSVGLISALGSTLDTRGRRDGEKRRPPLTATTLGSVEAVSQKVRQ